MSISIPPPWSSQRRYRSSKKALTRNRPHYLISLAYISCRGPTSRVARQTGINESAWLAYLPYISGRNSGHDDGLQNYGYYYIIIYYYPRIAYYRITRICAPLSRHARDFREWRWRCGKRKLHSNGQQHLGHAQDNVCKSFPNNYLFCDAFLNFGDLIP
jgi:hypothetical protein